MPCQEGVQFELLPYKSALDPGLGGEKGIPIVHLVDCCMRWFACMMSPPRAATDFLQFISTAWANAVGNLKIPALDGGTGMRSKEFGDRAMYNQTALKYKAVQQTAWLVARHNLSIWSALRRAEGQAFHESLCIGSVIAFGLGTFEHNASVSISNHTSYRVSPGRRPHLLAPL